MINWFAASLLMVESSQVVTLRCAKLARGGKRARREAALMVSEKIIENNRAFASLMTGGSPDAVIARYRKRVAANARRLGRKR